MKPDEYLQAHPLDGGTLYYPGSGTDYGPFKLFSENGAVSKVVYVDYKLKQEEAEVFIHGLADWRAGEIKQLQPTDFRVPTWDGFWHEDPKSRQHADPATAFGLQTELSSPNASAVQFIFFATEAIKTLEVLVKAKTIPSVIVLQEHGFGGSWGNTKFGGEDALYETAVRFNALPRLLFVAENTEPWPEYDQVSSHVEYRGQLHHHLRALFAIGGAYKT